MARALTASPPRRQAVRRGRCSLALSRCYAREADVLVDKQEESRAMREALRVADYLSIPPLAYRVALTHSRWAFP